MLSVEPSLVFRFKDHLARFLAQELPVRTEHGILAGSFPTQHRDPFDRTLAAQCQLEGLPLITSDPAFSEFPTQVMW